MRFFYILPNWAMDSCSAQGGVSAANLATAAALRLFCLLSLAGAAVAGDHDEHGFSFEHLAAHVNSSTDLSGDSLDVFIVPHTHDDTGWLSTVDEYYIGQVQWILSTLEPALSASTSGPARKFS